MHMHMHMHHPSWRNPALALLSGISLDGITKSIVPPLVWFQVCWLMLCLGRRAAVIKIQGVGTGGNNENTCTGFSITHKSTSQSPVKAGSRKDILKKQFNNFKTQQSRDISTLGALERQHHVPASCSWNIVQLQGCQSSLVVLSP